MEQSMMDVRLRQHVLEELAEDPHVDAADIRVEASSGRIVLTGSVTSESQKQAAGRDTWWVDTVRAVENRLIVDLRHDEVHDDAARASTRQPD
jgi:osmotically-inducible protein OsmY